MKLKSFILIFILSFVFIFACNSCGERKLSEKDGEKNTNSSLTQNDEYSPVSSLTLTETEAASLKGSIKVKVYYKTARGDKLCSETKLLQFTDKDRKLDVLAGKIVDMMVAGPTNTSLVKTLPEGTKLNSIKIKSGVAYVDFNDAFSKGLGNDAIFIAYSIANTLTEFKNIHQVAITVNGNKIDNAGCNFSNLLRNTEIVTNIESALPKTDYSENVFLETELE